MAVFAGITVMGIVFGEVIGSIVVSTVLGFFAWNELRGGARIRRFDPTGARILGWNQIGLGIAIVIYAAWSLVSSLGTLSSLTAQIGTTGDPSMDAMVSNISTMVTYCLYGGLIVVGVIVPGLTAWYYFSRERIIRSFVERTPVWVVDTLRAAG